MHKYQITIFWSDEDDAFIAVMPELRGCSAHGQTYEEALKEAQVAMSLWLETAEEFGNPIPPPARKLVAPAAAG